ncbi:MAG: glutamate racemase [Verrucomicrobia bacterium]|nr:glutamate racemase [Verrucomicrobiota bacterium]MBS0636052.1 glutamate racemase [Verrucomicrobiota bacterium]
MTKVGLFDSGVGGLTVLKELIAAMPHKSYVYFADTARYPYGGKSQETIIRYSLENSNFLLEQGVELIAIACHTATSLALHELQKNLNIPILGVIEPAVEKMVATTKNKHLGVLGTRATIASGMYQRKLLEKLPDATITACACPLFVPIIEEQITSPEIIKLVVKETLAPFKGKSIDTLLLGCTHYPLLQKEIQEEMGPHVTLVNPAKTFAEMLQKHNLAKSSTPELSFFVSDDPERFRAIGESFLGISMPHVKKV